jgi:hypothetical protein
VKWVRAIKDNGGAFEKVVEDFVNGTGKLKKCFIHDLH